MPTEDRGIRGNLMVNSAYPLQPTSMALVSVNGAAGVHLVSAMGLMPHFHGGFLAGAELRQRRLCQCTRPIRRFLDSLRRGFQ